MNLTPPSDLTLDKQLAWLAGAAEAIENAVEILRADNAKAPTRFDHQHSIEDAIMAFRPELDEACEILDALTAALKKRYPDELSDVLALAKELREAMTEAQGNVEFYAPDEATLAKWAAERGL